MVVREIFVCSYSVSIIIIIIILFLVPTTQLVQDFMFEAPTTCLNTLRLLRALQISTRAVLLEGNPGVGKTSVVMALARATGNKVIFYLYYTFKSVQIYT